MLKQMTTKRPHFYKGVFSDIILVLKAKIYLIAALKKDDQTVDRLRTPSRSLVNEALKRRS